MADKGYTKQMQAIEDADVALEKVELLASDLFEMSLGDETVDIKKINLKSCMLLDYVEKAQKFIQTAIKGA